ncbi:MAG: MBL fold metallo-hydrolase [Bradymonadales bacterium]|nr:MBL fold metallo-hydrolase [Bradymonadales bacterium]
MKAVTIPSPDPLFQPSSPGRIDPLPAILTGLLSLLLASCLNLEDPEIQLTGSGQAPEGEGIRCLSGLTKEDGTLRIHFIDIGQGDSIWIETPTDNIDGNGEREGYHILIDTGEADNAQILVDYLTRYGFPPGSLIDYLVITHAHADHYGGATVIMDNYLVHNILDPGFDDSSAWYYTSYLQRAAEEIAETGGVLYRPLVGTLVGDLFETTSIFGSEIETVVLNSDEQLQAGEDRYDQINNTSIALALTYQFRTILLMADVQTEMEPDIINAMPDLRANILKVGHHGSTTSTSTAFLDHIFADVDQSLRFAVVQSGTRLFGSTNLPSSTIVSRLLQYVSANHYYTTNHEDDETAPFDGAGDDHVQAVINEDGSIQICYAP